VKSSLEAHSLGLPYPFLACTWSGADHNATYSEWQGCWETPQPKFLNTTSSGSF